MHRHLNDSPSLSQGCRAKEEHAVNMHFAPSTIHYSGSHWALTYQNNRKLTTGGMTHEEYACPPLLVPPCLPIHPRISCIAMCNFAVSPWWRASQKKAGGVKIRQKKNPTVKRQSPVRWNCSPPASWFAWLSTPLTSEWHDTIWGMMNAAARRPWRGERAERQTNKARKKRRESSNRSCCLKGYYWERISELYSDSLSAFTARSQGGLVSNPGHDK